MGYCTGIGEENGNHCCYVNGVACTHLMDQAATVAWINSQGWGATKRNAAITFAQNIPWICRIGLTIFADVTQARNNRSRYETEFANNAEYLAFPAPQWRQIEQATGAAAGSLDCWRWQGEPTPAGGRTCCYRKTTAQCDADVAARGISTTAVTVRKAGGRTD